MRSGFILIELYSFEVKATLKAIAHRGKADQLFDGVY
jgi:hypothetical protein